MSEWFHNLITKNYSTNPEVQLELKLFLKLSQWQKNYLLDDSDSNVELRFYGARLLTLSCIGVEGPTTRTPSDGDMGETIVVTLTLRATVWIVEPELMTMDGHLFWAFVSINFDLRCTLESKRCSEEPLAIVAKSLCWTINGMRNCDMFLKGLAAVVLHRMCERFGLRASFPQIFG